jgi:hypothetical protein
MPSRRLTSCQRREQVTEAKTIKELEGRGFEWVGAWPEDWRENDTRASFSTQFPDEHGIYAFVEGDEVVYIGKAEKQSVITRVRKYVNSKSSGTGATAKRVQGKVDEALVAGKLITAYFLTLDTDVIDIREAEFIREWQPRWNKRGIRPPL